ncbi:50S ribosomal protein L32e [Candidatus Pacearchaeota archaeon]|nr:50S ribosomal protein L32e [Candidatus Pacearchaeota archaeon]
MSKEFMRQDWMRHLRLGKIRRKKQKWRRPKGRDSKMRLKQKSYPKSVAIGYKKSKTSQGKINGLKIILINNLKDLKKVGKSSLAILGGKVGAKKKLDIIKKAEEEKIKIINVGGKNET